MSLQDTLDQINSFDINDIDWSRMGVWPVAAKVFVCVLLVAAVLAGGYYLWVKDLQIKLEQVVAKEESLRSSFRIKAAQAANLEAYRAQMQEMEETFGSLLKQLPGDTEVPGLIEDIDEIGSASGLQIKSIDLKPEAQAEFYVELPISINVGGSYHDLGSFVSGVAGMSRIVTLHDYTIAKAKEGLGMTILAKTYRYKSEEK